ncbi:Transcription factor HIVEP2 [Frankliniella fusca]|uniref:Transcription factor HIVEP2 n=1 Tax=Frankliniella fusca TaxID=407009 RepID=A0AAE1GSX0_9NEOP|nr:Transcription factor HIVEP2 [Frankliniella fusca]
MFYGLMMQLNVTPDKEFLDLVTNIIKRKRENVPNHQRRVRRKLDMQWKSPDPKSSFAVCSPLKEVFPVKSTPPGKGACPQNLISSPEKVSPEKSAWTVLKVTGPKSSFTVTHPSPLKEACPVNPTSLQTSISSPEKISHKKSTWTVLEGTDSKSGFAVTSTSPQEEVSLEKSTSLPKDVSLEKSNSPQKEASLKKCISPQKKVSPKSISPQKNVSPEKWTLITITGW